MMTFKDRYLAGEVEFEAIDDYVEEWNGSDDPRTLARFLGLNEEEEDIWIEESDEALKELLDSKINEHKIYKKSITFIDKVTTCHYNK